MSRTTGHNKHSYMGNHQGHDLWSKRPCSSMSWCKYNKKLTTRKERQQDNKTLSDIKKGNYE